MFIKCKINGIININININVFIRGVTMYECFYPDCDVSEYDLEIVPKKECPNCHKYMNAEEHED